jgi:hypothetical protein
LLIVTINFQIKPRKLSQFCYRKSICHATYALSSPPIEITLLTLAFNISNDNWVFMDVIEVPSLLIKQEIASVSLMEIGWM